MIAVIADDFTGAAEVGGIGLRHGLKVVIETNVEKPEVADLLIIVADTRTMPADLAKAEIALITKKLLALKPTYIYKKLDSVLRGNVAQELEGQMEVAGKDRAVIVAGNPHFNRLIKGGIYFVNGVPLSDTFFSKDADYQHQSSSVIDILGGNDANVFSVDVDETLPEKGLLVANISNKEDMEKWTEKINQTTVASGGAGFFEVLLQKEFAKQDDYTFIKYKPGAKSLFIFGSAYPKTKEFKQMLIKSGMILSNMPEEIYRNKNFKPSLLANWADEVIGYLNANKKVVVTTDYTLSAEQNISYRVRKIIGQLVKMISDKVDLDDLLIEGGATASMIFKYMKISCGFPFQEVDNGVIQMKVGGYPHLCVTTKPGSYIWPESMLQGDELQFIG